MLKDIIGVVNDLNVYPENIKRNLDITNEVYFSQKVLTLLLDKGMARQKVYELVQKNALESWTQNKSFRQLIFEDEEIKGLCSEEELEKAFSQKELMAGIDKIFERFIEEHK
ncbi:MAG: adenylosuccinate lyase, partial [bacterium]|nr:adenylosuccinate lyase [bacterium]